MFHWLWDQRTPSSTPNAAATGSPVGGVAAWRAARAKRGSDPTPAGGRACFAAHATDSA